MKLNVIYRRGEIAPLENGQVDEALCRFVFMQLVHVCVGVCVFVQYSHHGELRCECKVHIGCCAG